MIDPDDIVDRTFEPLPLGAIEPRGWLERQLRIQREGLTGNLDEFWPDLADNQWLGGTNDGWERGPYYVDGLLPLAHLLDDPALIEKAETWVEGFLDGQDESGWIGPANQARDQGHEYDPWPRFVLLKVLTQHHEATGDERALEAMLAFCRWLAEALGERELERWGYYRWADLLVSVYWLYERTGEEFLLDLAAEAAEQGYHWTEHFDGLSGYHRPYAYDDVDGQRDLSAHVVNNAMGIKAPAVRYRLSREEADRIGSERAIETLDTFHGQATGLFSGDEFLAGKHPSRGTELCAVVEYMYSLEQLVAVLGNARHGDRLERLAFNALPAAFTPDMWSHQYDQQANQAICNVAEKDWSNGPDANIFGVAPNFGCCTANMHQAWPKFASHLWMRRGDGLVAVAYAPCTVTTEVEGTPVTVEVETAYPFEETVSIAVDPEEPIEFPLSLRIPAWTEGTLLTHPDGSTERIETPGADYHEVRHEWSSGDTLEIEFSTPIRSERRYHGAVAFHWGPLTFSLPVDAEWKHVGGEKPHADWEVYPAEPWNYGLEVDFDDPGATVSIERGSPGDVPFSPSGAPVELHLSGRVIPHWGLDSEFAWAGTVPNAVVRSDEPTESLQLIPYGCTNLRVTEFPIIG